MRVFIFLFIITLGIIVFKKFKKIQFIFSNNNSNYDDYFLFYNSSYF